MRKGRGEVSVTMGTRCWAEVQTSPLWSEYKRARARLSFCLSKRVSMSWSIGRRRRYHRGTSVFASSSSTWEAPSKPQAAGRISLWAVLPQRFYCRRSVRSLFDLPFHPHPMTDFRWRKRLDDWGSEWGPPRIAARSFFSLSNAVTSRYPSLSRILVQWRIFH